MPDTTPRFGLSTGELEETILRLDTLLFGAWAPRLAAIDPATRTFAWHGGTALNATSDGHAFIANGTIVCTDNTVSFIQRTKVLGVVSADAVLDLTKVPMARVVCSGGVLVSFEDIRDLALSY